MHEDPLSQSLLSALIRVGVICFGAYLMTPILGGPSTPRNVVLFIFGVLLIVIRAD